MGLNALVEPFVRRELCGAVVAVRLSRLGIRPAAAKQSREYSRRLPCKPEQYLVTAIGLTVRDRRFREGKNHPFHVLDSGSSVLFLFDMCLIEPLR